MNKLIHINATLSTNNKKQSFDLTFVADKKCIVECTKSNVHLEGEFAYIAFKLFPDFSSVIFRDFENNEFEVNKNNIQRTHDRVDIIHFELSVHDILSPINTYTRLLYSKEDKQYNILITHGYKNLSENIVENFHELFTRFLSLMTERKNISIYCNHSEQSKTLLKCISQNNTTPRRHHIYVYSV